MDPRGEEVRLREEATLLFHELDRDGGGTISVEEATAIFGEDDQWDYILEAADVDGDGEINEMEWVAYVVEMGREDGFAEGIEAVAQMRVDLLKASSSVLTEQLARSSCSSEPLQLPYVRCGSASGASPTAPKAESNDSQLLDFMAATLSSEHIRGFGESDLRTFVRKNTQLFVMSKKEWKDVLRACLIGGAAIATALLCAGLWVLACWLLHEAGFLASAFKVLMQEERDEVNSR